MRGVPIASKTWNNPTPVLACGMRVVVAVLAGGMVATLVGTARVDEGVDDTGAIIEPAPEPPPQAASGAEIIAISANLKIWFWFTHRIVVSGSRLR